MEVVVVEAALVGEGALLEVGELKQETQEKEPSRGLGYLQEDRPVVTTEHKVELLIT